MDDPRFTRAGVQLLEQHLILARQDPEQRDLARWLEQQIRKIRREQNRLIQKFRDKYLSHLLGLAARLVGRQHAEDVAQEAFVCLARWIVNKPLEDVMRLLENQNELDFLMRRITVCRARDLLRRKDPPADGDADTDQLADPAWQSVLPAAAGIAHLERAYEQLPLDQRIAHVLHYYYGCTDTEIAQMIEIKKSTVRSLVFRANHALQRAMEDNEK